MTSFPVICEAVAARVRPVLFGWEVLGQPNLLVPAPCAVVQLNANQYANYQLNLGGVVTAWSLKITLHVPAASQEAAWLRMGELTDPSGQLIRRLRDVEDEIDDDLSRLCRDVKPTVARGWTYRGNGQKRSLRSDIGVELLAA